MSLFKKEKDFETRLVEAGYSVELVRDYVGTKNFVVKEDANRNLLFIGPTGRLVVLTPEGKVYTCINLYCIVFSDDIKYKDYTVELISNTEPNIIRVDLDHPNLKEVKQLPDLPIIRINNPNYEGYAKIDWSKYMGQKVLVIITGKEIYQEVVSLKTISEENPVLAKHIENFLNEAKSYKEVEAGKWFITGKNKIHVSKIFTSSKFKEITANNAFPALAETIKKALEEEQESDLKKLTLIHTHPVCSPLSSKDIQSIKELAKDLDMKKGNAEILAISIKEKIIFRYSL
ncbi:hypothetical protein HY837_00535 [archaeon]|nr:hypothetical protein [archaeon]